MFFGRDRNIGNPGPVMRWDGSGAGVPQGMNGPVPQGMGGRNPFGFTRQGILSQLLGNQGGGDWRTAMAQPDWWKQQDWQSLMGTQGHQGPQDFERAVQPQRPAANPFSFSRYRGM